MLFFPSFALAIGIILVAGLIIVGIVEHYGEVR